MTTAWEDLRDEIREDIEDTKDQPRYSNELLLTYVKDAIKDYSNWFPMRIDAAALSGSGSGPYTIPDDMVNILFVECPANRFLERRIARPGTRYPKTTGRPFFFYKSGGNLYLDGSPLTGEEVLLTYEALHDIPEADDDTLTIPVKDEELIRLYVKAKVYERIRTKAARLDRYKEGDRQDNPITPEVRNLMLDYDTKMAARYEGGTIMLHRQGRTK